MAKKYVALRVDGAANYELPAAMNREIGRIITRWGYFEHCVQEMNSQVLGLTPAAGRIAIREPRAEDRLEMLNDLIKLRNGKWDDALYKTILREARLLKAKRDLVAHGIWHHNMRDGWCVQLTRGSWPNEVRDLVKGSRRITPESIPLDADGLREATRAIESLIDRLKKFHGAR